MVRKPTRFSTLLSLVVLMTSCSLDYSQVDLTDEMSERIPNSILYEFTYIVVENGNPVYRLDAQRAEFYNRLKETIVDGLEFRELDADGSVYTSGNADRAVYYTDSENAELTGNLEFYSAVEESTVTTDYLYWNQSDKILTGRPDGRVTISEDSGSRLDGIGFEADMRRRLIDFSGPVSGRYVTKEHE